MRSYVKAYQHGSVFYGELGEVPGAVDAIWAILRPHKAEWLNTLNYGYNTFVGGISYIGPDPNLGVAIASLYPGGFIQFEDYSLHPPD